MFSLLALEGSREIGTLRTLLLRIPRASGGQANSSKPWGRRSIVDSASDSSGSATPVGRRLSRARDLRQSFTLTEDVGDLDAPEPVVNIVVPFHDGEVSGTTRSSDVQLRTRDRSSHNYWARTPNTRVTVQ